MRQILISSLALLAACSIGPASDLDFSGAPFGEGQPVVLTPEQTAGVLGMLNDCRTTMSVIDVDANLDARAARNIIAHRDGADAACGTADDDRFDTLTELDAVSFVGDTAINALLAFAVANGWVTTAGDPIVGTFDGVPFTAAEIDGVLAIANHATCAVLDNDVGLDSRAADGIVQARPFDGPDPIANLGELAAVPFVGATALNALKAFIPSWLPACPALGGVFETVAFTDVQANDVLDLSNHGAAADLDAITGIGPSLATSIVGNRPLATVTAVGAVSGIGAAVLTALRDETAAKWCTKPAAACGCGSSGTSPSIAVTVDGVDFTAAEVVIVVDIANRALSAQLRADGGLDQAPAQTLILGRAWPDLAAIGNADGIGTVVMTQLRTYANSGLWRGPGDIQSAVTVAYVAQNATALVDTWVSFNRVLMATASTPGGFSGTIKDQPSATTAVNVMRFGADPAGEPSGALPALSAGEWYQLVHLKVTLDYGQAVLRLVESSEYTRLGCEPGWSRACGIDTGVCFVGTETCANDAWSTCTGYADQLAWDPPDGADNDCDGQTDENTYALTEVGHLAEPLQALAVNGGDSVGASATQILRLDLSNPAAPVVLERTTPALAQALNVKAIQTFAGGTVVSDCKNGVWTYASPATGLSPVVSLPSVKVNNSTGCTQDAMVDGDLLVLADWYNGFYGYDIAGAAPVESFRIPLTFGRRAEPFANGFFALGNTLAYYDTGALASPVMTAQTTGYVQTMALSASGLLAISSSTGIAIWDVKDMPTVVAHGLWTGVLSATFLDFQDHFLAVATGGTDRALSVIDLAVPSAPKLVATISVPNPSGVTVGSQLKGIAFSGDVVYAWATSGLHAIRLGQ